MIVPDTTVTGPVRMIHTPITPLIIGGQDIDRGNGEIRQVPTPLPFQDHEGLRKARFVQ